MIFDEWVVPQVNFTGEFRPPQMKFTFDVSDPGQVPYSLTFEPFSMLAFEPLVTHGIACLRGHGLTGSGLFKDSLQPRAVPSGTVINLRTTALQKCRAVPRRARI